MKRIQHSNTLSIAAAKYARHQFPTAHRIAAFSAYKAGFKAAQFEALETVARAMAHANHARKHNTYRYGSKA